VETNYTNSISMAMPNEQRTFKTLSVDDITTKPIQEGTKYGVSFQEFHFISFKSTRKLNYNLPISLQY